MIHSELMAEFTEDELLHLWKIIDPFNEGLTPHNYSLVSLQAVKIPNLIFKILDKINEGNNSAVYKSALEKIEKFYSVK